MLVGSSHKHAMAIDLLQTWANAGTADSGLALRANHQSYKAESCHWERREVCIFLQRQTSARPLKKLRVKARLKVLSNYSQIVEQGRCFKDEAPQVDT